MRRHRGVSRTALALTWLVATAILLIWSSSAPLVRGASSTTESGDNFSTDKPSYIGNATIIVSGVLMESADNDVTITIMNPSGVQVAVADQTTDADNGGFTVAFKAGGQTWTEGGTYAVTVVFVANAQQTFSMNTTFSYSPLQSATTTGSVSSSTESTTTPGFPLEATGLVAIAAVAVVALSILLRRKGRA